MLISPQNKSGKAKPLSERLSAIAEGLPKGGVVCDVGSDHGALPLYLLQNGYCRRCIVTDLNESPLRRAQNCLEENGLSHRATFLLTDGLEKTLSLNPEAYVIAGMGGETISGILDRAKGSIRKGTFFALQPMTKETLLRRYLYENGFSVQNETVVSENGKCFWIVFAVFDGEFRRFEDDFYVFGEYLPQKRDEAVFQYLSLQKYHLEKKIRGMNQAGKPVAFEEGLLTRLCAILEEFHGNL